MVDDFNLDFDDVDIDVSDIDISDVDIPDADLPDSDLPEEGISQSEDLGETSYTSDDNSSYGDDEQHEDFNPSFKAHLYTKKEIAAKIEEAEDKIQYYKSQEVIHAKRAHGVFEQSELSSVREAHRNVEKWAAIKRRWENETPKK